MASAAVATPSLDDEALVEQARGGDMGAFSRLVTRYQDRVVNTCWRICGNAEDAQDLAQEAFLHALQAIGSFQRRSRFYTWLFRIAVNLTLTHRRRSARIKFQSIGDGGELDGTQAGALSAMMK